ncbi:MAG: thiol:disulfide interchange protein [Burkholderiales bacterium RIFCSPHIGHO2_12_FULL_69_20]|nr:MAG: thiol:disulfide interchange protein [Burkholderiales bacterium RIFCSPHIGHO2_12_FULL_69_20]
MKRWQFIAPLALFVVLLGFLGVGLNLNPREVPSPLINKPAPDFALPRLDDPSQTIALKDLAGRVWMLNVWASWCVACREEHPLLVDYSRRATVPLYGLNYKDTRADALAWLARFGNPYTASLSDTKGLVGIDFGVYGVPETFIIDKQGVVRFKHIGPVTPQVLHERIEPLLKELNA